MTSPDSQPHPVQGTAHVAPLRAIRKHCLACCNGSSHEVALCVSTRCPLWLFRSGHRPSPEMAAQVASVVTHPAEQPLPQAEVAGLSRLKAIRRRCLDCSGYNLKEVRNCRQTGCDLHAFRMGKSGRTMTEEQRAAVVVNLRRYAPRTVAAIAAE